MTAGERRAFIVVFYIAAAAYAVAVFFGGLKMLVTKEELNAVAFASSDDPRYCINALDINAKGEIRATNGHILIVVRTDQESEAYSLPVSLCKAVARGMKRGDVADLNGSIETGGATFQLPAVDPDSRPFPSVDNVIPELTPERDDEQTVAYFDPKCLETLAAYYRKAGCKCLRVQLSGTDKPVRFDSQDLDHDTTVVLMPVHKTERR